MQPRDLSDHEEYVPGRGVEDVARERGLDPANLLTLSSNENALGPSPAAVAAIRAHAERIHRYPKAAHTDLTTALAERWDVADTQVWLANGGDGVIDYLCRAMLDPGDRILTPSPGFAYYGMSARYHHGTARTYRLRRAEDFAMDPDRIIGTATGERILFITSPHNPTGQELSLDGIARLADETDPQTLVVVDEAYGAFGNVESAIKLVGERDDVAVLRSFSKSHGLAGIRLGYGIVPEAWGEAFARVNTPFAASELACRAGLAALDDEDHLAETVEMVRRGRELLAEELAAETWPSGGNFVLADVGDATAVADALLDRGVIVRDCTSFGLPSCIRITVAPQDQLRRAIEECNAVLDGKSAVTDP